MTRITTLWLTSVLVAACGEPDEPGVDVDGDGYVSAEDCDDTDPTAHPWAEERCDGVDNDCDGEVDEGEDIVDGSTWYADQDDDGHGDPRLSRTACDQPEGWLAQAGDCDDSDPVAHEGAEELCDGLDNDCDGEVDEGLDEASTWYADRDRDGFGSEDDTVTSCVQPEGYVAEGGDCNDRDAALGPHVDERCDGVDNDCDGEVDEDPVDGTTYYADVDEDGYGDGGAATAACTRPAGTVTNDEDCDDTDSTVSPEGVEACDGVDDDCDGEVDEAGAAGELTFYLDGDSDGFGLEGSTALACELPTGYAAEAGDCDDGDPDAYPGADETCGNGVDEDCDGVADDGCEIAHCGAIAASETWAAGVVHRVTCDVHVGGPIAPALTIEDGTEVVFDAETGLYVGWTEPGSIAVDGAVVGVTFDSSAATPAAESWTGLFLGPHASASTLTGLSVSHAGDGLTDGAVTILGSAPSLSGCTVRDSGENGLHVATGAMPTVTGCTFEDNVRAGVLIEDGAGLSRGAAPTFTDNALTRNATAMILPAGSADMLDPSSTFAGNAVAGVLLRGDAIEQDATWLDLDEPFVVTADVSVVGSTAPLLTIGAGVEVRFDAGARIDAGYSGAGSLRAVGTAAEPILFTSASPTPAAGDWYGLHLGPLCDEADVLLDHVTIDYGGGPPSTGALVFDGCDGAVDHATIRDSGSWGLICWAGATPTIGAVTYAANAAGDESCL